MLSVSLLPVLWCNTGASRGPREPSTCLQDGSFLSAHWRWFFSFTGCRRRFWATQNGSSKGSTLDLLDRAFHNNCAVAGRYCTFSAGSGAQRIWAIGQVTEVFPRL